MADEGESGDGWTPDDHGASGAPRSAPRELPRCQVVRGPRHHAVPTCLYVVEGPHGLSHKGFYITTASYRLEDDVGKCPVHESRGAREYEDLKDKNEKFVAGVALELVEGYFDANALEVGELARYRVEVVGRYDVLSSREPIDESRVFFDGRGHSVPRKLNTACWGSQNLMTVLMSSQSMGQSTSSDMSPMILRMKAW
ncbi:hypothetical protein CRG98_024183 [Punica granatum]|uniref:Uncharacterized protein n=1 Tax=Punica granatum TaxID=22663 RepID=A0A2I0JHL2_PUNGR|nr:hypothetical protein CRG98_024183 [Punica granatum]